MLDHPENYVIKCEFRTGNQFIQDRIGFYVYLFWDADLFNVQNFNRWQTISLPLVVNRSATYTDNFYYKSFNIRLECYQDLARNFAFDNFRICPKNDWTGSDRTRLCRGQPDDTAFTRVYQSLFLRVCAYQ